MLYSRIRVVGNWLSPQNRPGRKRRSVATRHAEVEYLEPRRLLTAPPLVVGGTSVDQAPVLSGFGGTLIYVQQGGAPLNIASNIKVAESNSLKDATVSVANWQSGDRLEFSNDAALKYNFTENLSSHIGLLTLAGIRSLADYQEELQTVAFFNVAGAPVTTTRVATIQVSDGIAFSNSVSENISFQHTPPVVEGFSGTMTYVKGGLPLDFASSVVLVDSQSSTLNSATVSFTNWNAGDRLDFTNSAALQHVFSENLTTHVATLKLSGTATLAAYQLDLRSLTFSNVAGAPVTTARKVSLQVGDGVSTSAAASETIVFGHAPVLSGFSGTLTYVEGGLPLNFAPAVVVSDPDSTTLSQATISVAQWQVGDRLEFSNDAGLQYHFSENLTQHTGVLTLTGTGSLAAYQAELRTLAFFNVDSAPDTTTRTVSIVVNSNGATSNTVTEHIAFEVAAPTVSIAPASTTEGDSGSKLLPFTVTLSHAATTAVTVNYVTANLTAVAGMDYTATSGTLTIPAGQTTGTINVSILGNTTVEPDKTFLVILSSPHHATLGTASAVGTILNDNSPGNVLSDNTFDSSSGTHLADSTHYLAASFVTGSNFALLQDITLLLARTTSSGSATVELYTGSATQPQTPVGTLISPSGYSTKLASTVFTTNGFALLPNTRYWVVLKPTSGTFQWSWTSSTASTGLGYTGKGESSADAGTTWSSTPGAAPQMKVVID